MSPGIIANDFFSFDCNVRFVVQIDMRMTRSRKYERNFWLPHASPNRNAREKKVDYKSKGIIEFGTVFFHTLKWNFVIRYSRCFLLSKLYSWRNCPLNYLANGRLGR